MKLLGRLGEKRLVPHDIEHEGCVAKLSEWPSGPASSISSTEVKHGCVQSGTGWATFEMKDQNSSLRHPSEGTLN